MKTPKNLGMLLLGVWLILYGVFANTFIPVGFAHSQNVLAVFAFVAGILLLRDR